MIKFTNAFDVHRGNVLFINRDHIVAVFEEASIPGGSLATKIVGVSGIIWTVEESVSEVIKQIGSF